MDYPIKTLQQIRPILLGFRKQAGLSQAQLASLLGISQQSYAKIEANPLTTSVERLITILRLLGVEVVLTQQNSEKIALPLPQEVSMSEAGDMNKVHRKTPKTARQDALYPDAALPSQPNLGIAENTRPRVSKPSAPGKLIPPSNKKESW